MTGSPVRERSQLSAAVQAAFETVLGSMLGDDPAGVAKDAIIPGKPA